ncbi:hypothetical protein KJ975_06730 [Myxococcota bacterium]|nr:hypothetical protein [Myxococcota bacterium]
MLLVLSFLLLTGLASCRLMMDIPDGPPVPAECGNGVEEGDEDCDGLDLGGKTCMTQGFTGGTLGCSATCEFDTSACSGTEPCGNGSIDDPEECDGENLDGQTCMTQGFTGGTLGCSATCEFDTSACSGTEPCGNGSIDDPEECDGDNLNGETCLLLGFSGGVLACTSACEFDKSLCEAPENCGNDVIDDAEECDGVLFAGDATCETQGYFGGGALVCNPNCTMDTSGCVAVCGNERIEPGETCDPGMRSSPGCSNTCQVIAGWDCQGEPSECSGICGDGMIVSDEDCEGLDVNGQDCTSIGLGYGSLTCTANCTFNPTHCHAVTNLAVGDRHSCAVLSTGAAYCWGDGDGGQLGAGNYAESSVPVLVGGSHIWVRISAAAVSTCAVTAFDGSFQQYIWCWGENTMGQLGTGNTLPSTLPVAVTNFPLSNEDILISTRSDFACAAYDGANPFCWGNNANGQLGTGNYISYQAPRAVQDLVAISAISTGYDHACAISLPGALSCWGGNGYGQIGIGVTSSPRTHPESISITNGPLKISAGAWFTCAVNSSQEAYCWGRNNYGQLGDGSLIDRHSPNIVPGLTGVADISAGGQHTCALMTDGSVKCWGRNNNGQLGNALNNDSPSPVAVSNINSAVAVAAGVNHTCALLSDGTAWCWGLNFSGQLGNGANVSSSVPVLVHF